MEAVPQWRIPEWFSQLDLKHLKALHDYHKILIKFNSSLNLVSPRSLLVADALHFADSIFASQVIWTKGQCRGPLYDFGSGNGFPGIVFAILYPSVQVILIDIDVRKCEFLKTVIHTLDLKNCKVENIQVDKLPERSVKFAVSRGFANISKSILMVRKVFSPDGVYFHMKSEEWPKEVAEIPTALCSYWTPEHVADYKIPVGEIKFAVVKTIRTKKMD